MGHVGLKAELLVLVLKSVEEGQVITSIKRLPDRGLAPVNGLAAVTQQTTVHRAHPLSNPGRKRPQTHLDEKGVAAGKGRRRQNADEKPPVVTVPDVHVITSCVGTIPLTTPGPGVPPSSL